MPKPNLSSRASLKEGTLFFPDRNLLELRAQGWSYDRIAQELGVAKGALISWSHKYRHQINNLRTMRMQALQERFLISEEARLESLAKQLKAIETELARRDLTKVPTAKLISLASALRREITQLTGSLRFTAPSDEIPPEEQDGATDEWEP